MIYEYCLVVGQVTPFTDSPPEADIPNIALFRVCKTMHEEAEPYLYLNTLILATSSTVERLINVCLHTPARKLMLKSVDLRLGTSALSEEDVGAINKSIQSRGPENKNAGTAPWALFIRYGPRLRKETLRNIIWPSVMSLVLDHTRLDSLVTNMSESFRRRGSCDMAASALLSLEKGFALGAPKKVEVTYVNFPERMEDLKLILDKGMQECVSLWTQKRAGMVYLPPTHDSHLVHSRLLIMAKYEGWEI